MTSAAWLHSCPRETCPPEELVLTEPRAAVVQTWTLNDWPMPQEHKNDPRWLAWVKAVNGFHPQAAEANT